MWALWNVPFSVRWKRASAEAPGSAGTVADAASQRLGPARPVEASAVPGSENGPWPKRTAVPTQEHQ